jgi:pre-mRNA-splicing factor RBM22/SLT11
VPPEDKTITTVYVGLGGSNITEKDLRDHFYQFGELRSVTVVGKQNCAFVTYTDREAAELAVERSFQKLVIHGQKLSIRWGRSQAKRGGDGEERNRLAPVPGLPVGTPDYFSLSAAAGSSSSTSSSSTRSMPMTIPALPTPIVAAPPVSSGSQSGIHYPSQDPQRLGSSGIKLPAYNKD